MTKYKAFGTVLKRGITPIAQVDAISGPGLSLDTEDVTTHDSDDGWEEVVGTILRSGELTLDVLYDPSEDTHKHSSGGLLHDMTERNATTYTLEFPTSPMVAWTFTALVTGFDPDAPHSGALRASVTMKLTGKPTLA